MRALRLTTLALVILALTPLGCSESSGPSEPTVPEVVDIHPADGAIHVAPWSSVVLRFNTHMDRAGVEAALAVSTPDKAFVPYSATWMGHLLELEFDEDLEDGTPYTVTLAADATSSGGEPLAEEFTSTFTSWPSHPVVLLALPFDGSIDAPRNTRARVRFSTSMDEASTTTGIVVDPPVSHTLTLEGSYVTFVFTDGLDALTTYSITIPGTAEEEHGGETLGADHTFSFTTGVVADEEGPAVVSFDPPNGSRNVSREIGEIVVTFSEPVVDMAMFGGIDMRFLGLLHGSMRLSEDQASLILPLRRLPPGEELWIDFGTFEGLQGLMGEDPPRYSFTTEGSSEIFPAHEDDAWFYVDYDAGESFVVRVENTSGNRFDMSRYELGTRIWDEFDELTETRHFLRTNDGLDWTGFEEDDDASEFTPPLRWLQFPLLAGSAWSDSTEFASGEYTIRVNYSCEVVDVADYTPSPVALREGFEPWSRYFDRSMVAAFPDCAQVRFEYLMRVWFGGEWKALESGDQLNYYCPGVGQVYRHDINVRYDLDGNPLDPEVSEFQIGGWMLDQ